MPKKLQSAMEYLMTYGWTLIILAVFLGAIFFLILSQPSQLAASVCIFPANFGCPQSILSTNGILYAQFSQFNPYPINITAIGCGTSTTPQMMPLSAPFELNSSANLTIQVPCANSSTMVQGIYKGHLVVNYTYPNGGSTHTVISTLVLKHQEFNPPTISTSVSTTSTSVVPTTLSTVLPHPITTLSTTVITTSTSTTAITSSTSTLTTTLLPSTPPSRSTLSTRIYLCRQTCCILECGIITGVCTPSCYYIRYDCAGRVPICPV